MTTNLSEDLSELLVSASLYSEFTVTSDEEIDRLYTFLFNQSRFDCYCLQCGKESTFKFEEYNGVYHQIASGRRSALNKLSYLGRTARCSRHSGHCIYYIFRFDENVIFKIGQFPSVADISIADTKKYHKILGKDNLREFNKAIGLFSHGIGIGSFVYLRRIFETLIEDAHQEAASKIPTWNNDDYKQAKTGERIDMLSDFLPSFLTQNKGIYSILSKGIHELAEKECMDMFPYMKICIEIILDEKIEMMERQKKTEQAQRSVQTILQSIIGK